MLSPFLPGQTRTQYTGRYLIYQIQYILPLFKIKSKSEIIGQFYFQNQTHLKQSQFRYPNCSNLGSDTTVVTARIETPNPYSNPCHPLGLEQNKNLEFNPGYVKVPIVAV